MTDQAILEKLTAILCTEAYQGFGCLPEQVTPMARFIQDLGLDSLDFVELVMAIEDEFEVEVCDEDAEKFTTVGEVVRWLAENTGRAPTER